MKCNICKSTEHNTEHHPLSVNADGLGITTDLEIIPDLYADEPKQPVKKKPKPKKKGDGFEKFEKKKSFFSDIG